MEFSLFLYIAISAGFGTAVVELFLNLFLSHWLKKIYFEYTLTRGDKRNCSDQILELINSDYQQWLDFSDDIYSKASLISDRLITLNQKVCSQKLDAFVQEQRNFKQSLDRLFSEKPSGDKNQKDFLDSQHKLDILRADLLKFATKLKSK